MSDFVLKILVKLFVLVAILPLHECAHGWMADKLGDHSAKMLGRITLNPAKHLDIFGAACMLLVGFGWAKPVPVNPDNFKWNNKKAATALVATAGPLSNLIAAFAGCFIWGLAALLYIKHPIISDASYNALSTVLAYFSSINIGLAVFNLIPIPPLDGSKILYIFLPDKWIYFIERYSQYIVIGLLVLMYSTGFGSVVSIVGNAVFNWMLTAISAFFNLFL